MVKALDLALLGGVAIVGYTIFKTAENIDQTQNWISNFFKSVNPLEWGW